jgi:hypothetical protein
MKVHCFLQRFITLLLAMVVDVAGQTLMIEPDLHLGRLRLQWPNRSNEVFQIQKRASHLEPQEMMTGELAHGFSRYLTPTVQDISHLPRTAFYSCIWSAGAMIGSPLEMALWTRALYQGEVLASNSMKQMTNMVNTVNFAPGIPRYGLGTIEVVSIKGSFFGHFGDFHGFLSLVAHSPRHNATALFVINTDSGAVDLDLFVKMVNGWKALVAKL